MAEEQSALELEEESLIAKSLDGDRTALASLLYNHYERLSRHIRRHLPEELRRVVDAEDILQQTFIKAYQGIATFQPRGPHSFSRWLTTIANHTWIDAVRQQRRRPPQVAERPGSPTHGDGAGSSAAGLLELWGVCTDTPSRVAARREAACAVHVALSALHPRQRQALSLVYLDSSSLEEAATRMGISKPAVHSLVYRGLQKLREVLGSLSDYLSSA